MEAILVHPHRPSNAALWTSRVLGAVLALFLFVDAAGKILRLQPHVEGTAKVGFPPGALVPLGLVLLACTVLWLVPRTRLLGALALTAYFGGAVATLVRMGEPFYFPVVFGVLVWACVFLRDAHARSFLLPLTRRAA